MKKIYLFLLIATSTINLFCQSKWTKHPGNPVMVAGPEDWEDTYIGPGSVIMHEGKYHMWYSAGHFPGFGNQDFKIGHATSEDGLNWIKDENPVLGPGESGNWDSRGVSFPSVLIREGVFHMWFTGYSSDGIFHSVGYATSPDGITWEKHASNPILENGSSGEWDNGNLKAPSVVFDGSEYHMFYDAFTNNAGNSIGHATSADGISWSKDLQNPILSSTGATWDYNTVQLQTAVYCDSTFHMWYSGGSFLEWDIGYATSVDGSVWDKHEGNPVLSKGEEESWESSLVSMPVVIADDSRFKMWYHGQASIGTGGIGYAESEFGCYTGVRISSFTSDQISIYPNPASDLINIQTSETGKYTLKISTVNGQIVMEREFVGSTFQLDLSPVKEGVYFISISLKGHVAARKIIKLL